MKRKLTERELWIAAVENLIKANQQLEAAKKVLNPGPVSMAVKIESTEFLNAHIN